MLRLNPGNIYVISLLLVHDLMFSQPLVFATINTEADTATEKPLETQEALHKLSISVSELNKKFSSIEFNLQYRMQHLEESFDREKLSLDRLSARLDILNSLNDKMDHIEQKLDQKTSLIENVVTITTKDVKRLASHVEDMERRHHDIQTPATKEEENQSSSEVGTDTRQDKRSKHNVKSHRGPPSKNEKSQDEIGSFAVQRIERVLPRLLAAELNHFYLNMATKVDHGLGELRNDFAVRLRRIETTTSMSLTEIQDGRQDVNHFSHIQRRALQNITNVLSNDILSRSNIESCQTQSDFSMAPVEDLLRNLTDEVSETITNTLSEISENGHRLIQHEGLEKDEKQSQDPWHDIFTASSSSSTALVGARLCPESLANDAIEEVKELLRSLLSKGEELRHAFTKQTGEGVDLLKLLHQRFSVLLRRMHTDPGHGEALLAEVQELEHLVENSYSSILHAQNIFIDSCNRIQSIEEQSGGGSSSAEMKIVEVLNKIVTNIDLGQQFNRKQLDDMKLLVQQIDMTEVRANLSSQQSMLKTQDSPAASSQHFDEQFSATLLSSIAEVNSTEDKFREVVNRISSIQAILQGIEANKNKKISNKMKNSLDELMTAAKDIRGYSRSQIHSLQNLQDVFLQLAEEHAELKASSEVSEKENVAVSPVSSPVSLFTASDDGKQNNQIFIKEDCAISLLNELRTYIDESSRVRLKTNEDNIGDMISGPPKKRRKGGKIMGEDKENEDRESLSSDYEDDYLQDHYSIDKNSQLINYFPFKHFIRGSSSTRKEMEQKNNITLMESSYIDEGA